MDEQKFDAIAKRLAAGNTRRGALRLLGGGALGALLAALGRERVAAGEVTPAACTANGVRCGANTPRGCGTCCSQCTSRQENGQRRCACCRDGRACRRDDQCCSGSCMGGVCGGLCPAASSKGQCSPDRVACDVASYGANFGNCYCETSKAGETFCGFAEGECVACETDGDCITVTGAGSRCVGGGPFCASCFFNRCVPPCPDPAR